MKKECYAHRLKKCANASISDYITLLQRLMLAAAVREFIWYVSTITAEM